MLEVELVGELGPPQDFHQLQCGPKAKVELEVEGDEHVVDHPELIFRGVVRQGGRQGGEQQVVVKLLIPEMPQFLLFQVQVVLLVIFFVLAFNLILEPFGVFQQVILVEFEYEGFKFLVVQLAALVQFAIQLKNLRKQKFEMVPVLD